MKIDNLNVVLVIVYEISNYKNLKVKNMKKLFVSIVAIALVSIVYIGIAEKNDLLDIKKWGTKEYYVQITEDGKEEMSEADDGTTVKLYWYTLKAYNKKGDEITVKFFANKNLKLNAFLRVDVGGKYKDKTYGIDSYEEVKSDDIPKKAREQIDKK
ncbi:YxeA family protein [Bacillus sp. DX4.1]|uniref:YxeA family protein n=1 Tax=Bacillus sp. DX4.1 TaxID=3055867 RepID=UPI0025A2403C|nr:YxeA family protein [Bacillus sp. DX4.1]MDM5188692.1 YxeA family protein [Bacillus sp. DX4.1]